MDCSSLDLIGAELELLAAAAADEEEEEAFGLDAACALLAGEA